jgi:hypothetical protein
MKLEVNANRDWDRANPLNEGVIEDQTVATSTGMMIRRVIYHCVLRDETFHFLTSEFTLPPGVIAHLYRARWEIEPSGARQPKGGAFARRAAPEGAGNKCLMNLRTS